MRRAKLFSLLVIFMAGLLALHFSDRATAAQVENEQAPGFTIKLLNGKDFDSSELKGKVAVLKFVASY